MKAVVVIPARLQSTRLPDKVLLKETGKFLVQHVWEAASGIKDVEKVIIATDHEDVLRAAESFNAEVVMTSPECRTGTDRVAEVARNIDADIIVNVQGDEPELDPGAVGKLIEAMALNPEIPMGTLAVRTDSADGLDDPSIVKLVVDSKMRALYFSRAPIPHVRDTSAAEYWWHIGVYAFRKEFLLDFVKMPTGRLEALEKLEQLRALENGASILVVEAPAAPPGIDTPEDYAAFVKRCKG